MKSVINGVNILCEHVPQMNMIILGIAVPNGSCDDIHSTPGTAHLNEHLHVLVCNQAIGHEKLRRISIEAFTEREETFFLLQSLPEDFKYLLEWLSYFLNPPEINEKDFESEKNIVLEELFILEGGEIDKIDNHFYDYGYSKSRYSLPIGGYTDNVLTLNRKDTFKNMLECHLRQGISVAAIGNISEDVLLENIAESIVNTPLSLSKPLNQQTTESLRPGKVRTSSNLEATYFLIGYPAFERTADNRISLYGLSHYLGNDIDNLLFRYLRRKTALLYSVNCECHLFKSAGHLVIKAVSSKKNFDEALDISLSICKELSKREYTKEHVEGIQHSLKKMLLHSLDIPTNKLLRLLKHELWFSTYFTLENDIDEIKKISGNSLVETAQLIFNKPELLCYGE